MKHILEFPHILSYQHVVCHTNDPLFLTHLAFDKQQQNEKHMNLSRLFQELVFLFIYLDSFKYLLSRQGDTKVFKTWSKRCGKCISRKKSSLNYSIKRKVLQEVTVRLPSAWKGTWVSGKSGKGSEITIENFSLDH